jgi:protein involved in sex pheromone biosynthesis
MRSNVLKFTRRIKMNKLAILVLLLSVVGCSTGNHQELVMDKRLQPMSRNETIVAVRECETNGLRAVMIYGKRQINGYSAEVVIEVSCAPKW